MRVTVLTGAGVSASAGLPMFRDPHGLWSDENFLKMSQSHLYGNYLDVLVPKWLELSRESDKAVPTLFHSEVARAGWRVVTQNVDSLHTRAGSADVLEVHGSLAEWRCLRCRKFFAPSLKCVECGSKKVRPNMVLFGERVQELKRAEKWISQSDVLVVAGTSGKVWPAASWPSRAGRAVLVDPSPWDDMAQFSTHFSMSSDEWAAAGLPLE